MIPDFLFQVFPAIIDHLFNRIAYLPFVDNHIHDCILSLKWWSTLRTNALWESALRYAQNIRTLWPRHDRERNIRMDINRGRHTNRLRRHASVLVIQRFFSCKYAPFDLDVLFQSITSRSPFDLKRQKRIIEFINKRPFFLSLFAPNRAAKNPALLWTRTHQIGTIPALFWTVLRPNNTKWKWCDNDSHSDN